MTWHDFARRYRGVVQRIQKLRQSEYRQFVFNLDQARDFLVLEKSFSFSSSFDCSLDCLFLFIELTTIFNALSFNEKLEPYELEKFFEACDLSVTQEEIDEALQVILQSKYFFIRFLRISFSLLKIIHHKRMNR